MAVERNDKKLNGAGLATLWGRITTLVSNSISALSTVYAAISHNHTKSEITDLVNATDSTGGLMTDAQAAKLAGIESGAQVNTISGIQKNGVDVQPDATSKKVNLAIPTKQSDLTNDDNTVKDASYVHTDNNYTSEEKTKLGGVAAGAQVNVVETIKVNNSALTPDGNKAVNITVPTDNSQLNNGAGYQTASQVNSLIDAKISTTYHAAGSKLFANLPSAATLADADAAGAILGDVYNVTDGFTVDARFLEYDAQKTKTYGPGTNVAVVRVAKQSGEGYDFFLDVLQGFVDLSNYATLDDVETLSSTDIADICAYPE